MTGISYDPGSTGIADTNDVTFAFDNVGNRTSMTDGTGSTSYVYNSLSQITSETKYISEINNSFTINYTYALNGAVTSFTDPQDSQRRAEYFFDRLGRITETRTMYQGTLLQKLHETQYRAWGALKKHTFVTIGTATTFSRPVEFEYDNRLRVSRHYSPNATTPSTPFHDVEYARNADGKIQLSTDLRSPTFTRNFEYDQVGRVTKSLSGASINNNSGITTPYRTNILYDSFSEETSVTGKHWEVNNPPYSPPVSLSTGRLTNSSYDTAGNVTSEPVPLVSNPQTYAYDAAGRNTSGVDPGHRNLQYSHNITTTYDGNGWRVKNQIFHNTPSNSHTKKTFEFSSTVLGGETVGSLAIDNYPGATEEKTFTATANGVKLHKFGAEFEWLSPEGTTMYNGFGEAEEEFDARGGAVGTENPYNNGGTYAGGGDYGDGEFYARCTWEHMTISCGRLSKFVRDYNHRKSNGDKPATPAQDAPAPSNISKQPSDKPEQQTDKPGAVSSSLIPQRFDKGREMSYALTDWVQLPGEVFFDSRVVDQETATELYGKDAIYRPVGYEYTASDGAKIVLGNYGFFTDNGQINTNGDRAENALKIQAADNSRWIMSGGLMIAEGLAADDVTGIGVADDPAIPVVVTGAAIAALAAKMTYEISKIQQRPLGPNGVQYSLRATTTGDYICFTCASGTMNLNAGDIWKIGETTLANRYTQVEMERERVEQFNEFSGNQVEIKVVEKVKIYAYFAAHGHLPPGNKIFR